MEESAAVVVKESSENAGVDPSREEPHKQKERGGTAGDADKDSSSDAPTLLKGRRGGALRRHQWQKREEEAAGGEPSRQDPHNNKKRRNDGDARRSDPFREEAHIFVERERGGKCRR